LRWLPFVALTASGRPGAAQSEQGHLSRPLITTGATMMNTIFKRQKNTGSADV
jgi:hypothetical protein